MRDLSVRERIAVGAALLALVLFLVLQFVLFPLSDRRHKLERGISAKQNNILEMQEMQERYRATRRQSASLQERLAKRPESFSLFSFIEQQASQTGVKDTIAYMKPTASPDEGVVEEVLVEMKLNGLSLQQLVDLLRAVESPDQVVAVKRLAVEENEKQADTLDVIMQVGSVASLKNGETGP